MYRSIFTLLLIIITFAIQAQEHEFTQDLKYRLIGPFRASRTVGAVGIEDQPNVFFVGVNNGGVWKTDDYGRTWNPIFDGIGTGSVGDIAVFQKDPSILYVGSGEGLHRPDLGVGDGVFKSIDGGQSWEFKGLPDVQQIARVIIHPEDPNQVYVAALGHPYGPNETRGVYKTVDGGETWIKVLYIDQKTGASQVEFDPSNPNVIFASLWDHREGPWENASFAGPNSGLYQSKDGGATWTQLSGGLPLASDGLGRIGIGIAPSNSRIIYATVDAKVGGGIYKSEDGGDSWKLINTDYRLWGRGGDFAEIRVHPKDPNTLFVGNIASYRSDDGGLTWTSIKGAPGGDDYHRIWINPKNPSIMIFAADQGATVTVNGGKTWSSWYNQPTAQIYHVTADHQFPYWIYGGQQESGAIGTASRGAGGQISFRDWIGVGADEYAYIAPDPKDSDIIYGGRVVRFNKKTGQTQYVGPEVLRSGDYRILRTMPLMWHPLDDEMLLFATNVLWATRNGGDSWIQISPDLSRPDPKITSSIGDYVSTDYQVNRRGVIYALAPSNINADVIWAGTDDGWVHVTSDGGKTWNNVTPPDLESWDKISQIDAGHFDEKVAFIAVNSIRKDDMSPRIYWTDDRGKTWKKITAGLPDNGPVNVIREDPIQSGLLFAGTERTVYFSPNNGQLWYPLKNNLPATSIRDLIIHEGDLIVGTHGRSIWVMDNVHPLRSLAKQAKIIDPFLVPPPTTYRVRDNHFLDTPLPPEEPAGENPPNGAIIDYFLPKAAQQVQINIYDSNGSLVRSYDSESDLEPLKADDLAHPYYWVKNDDKPSTEVGHHRFIWDLKWTRPKGAKMSLPISAVIHRTSPEPSGPYVAPGSYRVELVVDGEIYQQPLEVVPDPRVEASQSDLELQYMASMRCYEQYHLLESLKETLEKSSRSELEKEALLGKGVAGAQDFIYGSIYRLQEDNLQIIPLQNQYLFVLSILQSADAKPTVSALDAINQLDEMTEQLRQKIN